MEAEAASENSVYLVKPVEGKGLGVVAARDIKPGQLICSESALIVTKLEKSEILNVNKAREIYKQVARLTKVQKKQMMSLHCNGERSVLNIFKMNCIYVDDDNIGLYLLISRMNHSCCPNSIDCKGLVKEVRAMKNIQKGEEQTSKLHIFLLSNGIGSK